MKRQLAAIMFADMVGYTALMQQDEEGARAARARNREVLVQRVADHDGKILQFYGDGALSVFQSAIKGVEAAVAIQSDLRTPPPIPVRIGLHSGDIIYDDDGVFGDGVNLAARVQALAVPGSVLISEKVFDDIKNQRGIETRSLGSFALKNVKKPMEIWAVTNVGLAVPDPKRMGSRPSQTVNSVAVLPFLNLSPNPENEFFSDGITEELLNALTRINGLQVTARTSSFAFKGRNQDIRTIAEELGVATVLEGSVRRDGDQVRITAQLINAKDGYHLFSKSYDRELLNIFDTQDEIARTIADELRECFQPSVGACAEGWKRRSVQGGEPHTAPDQVAPGRKAGHLQHFHNTEAYTEFLKGVHKFNQWTPEGARGALGHFEKAIHLDKSCALPHSGTATAYTFLAALGHMPGALAYPKARMAAIKALELEEWNGESHAAMATVLFFYDWDFPGAYRHFQKALTLTPGSSGLRSLYAMYLKAIGDMEAAEEELQWAAQMDPLSPSVRTSLGEVLLHQGRFEEAEAELRRVLELAPDFRSAREMLGWTFIAWGRYEDALRELNEITHQTGDPFKVIPHRMWALTRMGKAEEARQLFRLLKERQEREPEVSLEVDFALAHLTLGEYDRSLDCLEEAVERRLGMVVFLNISLPWEAIRHHSRFQALVRRVGIPEPKAEPSPA